MEPRSCVGLSFLACLVTIIGVVVPVGYFILYPPDASLPLVWLESMSITAVNMTSPTQVKANIEVVIPLKNYNDRNTMVYTHINIKAFHVKEKNNTLAISDNTTTAAPSLVLRGGQEGKVVVHMEGVTVDVDYYEQHNLYGKSGTYGVSSLKFVLLGFLKMKDGRFLPSTSNLRAECQVLTVVFPVSPLNQTQALDVQPMNVCLDKKGSLFYVW